MNHKYLDDIGATSRIPSEWLPGDNREQKWSEERDIYGFDSRDTWSMDCAFICWLYERLKMYNEVNIVDTSYHKYEFEGEILSFQDCIDRLLNGCETYLKDENWEFNEDKSTVKAVEDIPKLFALCFWSLWW